MTRRDVPAVALAALLTGAGVAHFVVPGGFDDIVPRVLPGGARLWTSLSGAVELLLAVGILVRRTRRCAATAAAIFFVLVFPANVKMAIDWRSRPAPEFAIALLRLPLQVPLVWWAWRVRTRTSRRESSGPRESGGGPPAR